MTVLIKHPGLPEAPPARTTEDAFEAIWKDKGWKVVETTDKPETDQAESVSTDETTAPAGVEPATGRAKKTEA